MSSALENPYILAHYGGKAPESPEWFNAAMAIKPDRSHFVSQGTDIELLTWGEVGKPGLLFLPGNGAHADWWSPIAPFFAEEWRCATLSWSGMGRSARRAEGYVISDFAQEARDAIAAARLDAGGPCIVIAHSMGGIVGLHAAARNPDVRGLIVIDSPLGMSRRRLAEASAGAPKAHPVHRPFATLADALARFRLSPSQPCVNDYMADHVARFGVVEDDGGWVWHFDPRRITVHPEQTDPPYGDLGCPAAFVYGDRSELLNAETMATSRAVLPEGTPFIAIPDAAHHVLLDQPLALVSALRGLLACWPENCEDWQPA